MGREPTIELSTYTTPLDEYRPTDQGDDNRVKTNMRISPGEVEDCTLEDVLKHRKTEQLVRLFDQYRRTPDGGAYTGKEITVAALQTSSEHHADLLDFIHWLPLRQSPATAGRVHRIATNSLRRIQQIHLLRNQAKRVEAAGRSAVV